MVHMAVEGKLIASKQIVDLKYLSLHQKVGTKLLDRNSSSNITKVSNPTCSKSKDSSNISL
jgi:hypothetical protein